MGELPHPQLLPYAVGPAFLQEQSGDESYHGSQRSYSPAGNSGPARPVHPRACGEQVDSEAEPKAGHLPPSEQEQPAELHSQMIPAAVSGSRYPPGLPTGARSI